jgi:hypothetical protein
MCQIRHKINLYCQNFLKVKKHYLSVNIFIVPLFKHAEITQQVFMMNEEMVQKKSKTCNFSL